jgi:hypothetical protein
VWDDDQARVGPALAQPGERAQQHHLVRRPGGSGHQRGGTAAQAEQRVIRRDGRHPRGHAVEARIAKHANALGRHAQPREPRRVRLGHRARGPDRRVAGAEQRARGPAEPPAPGADGGRDEGHHDAVSRGTRGQLGPEVQLGEHQQVWRERAEQPLGRVGEIVRQVVGGVHRQPMGKRLGGWAEVGVDQLTVGEQAAQLEQHALCLESLADRGGMEPDQCARPVAPGGGPGHEPGRGAGPQPVALAHLPVDQRQRGGQRRPQSDGGAIDDRGGGHRGNVASARAARQSRSPPTGLHADGGTV